MIDLAQTGDFSDSYPFRNFRSVSLPAYEPTGKDFVDLIGHDQFYAYTWFYDHDAVGKLPDAAF